MNQEPLALMEGSSADLSPHPFRAIPRLWLKVPRMYEEEFMVAELPRASGRNVLLSVLVRAALASVAKLLSPVLAIGVAMLLSPILPTVRYFKMLLPPIPGSYGALSAFVGFYVSTGLVYLSARIFGGRGHFVEHSYLRSLFFVPLGILSWLCSFFPVIGPMVSIWLSIYNLMLNVRAVKVAHRLPHGKAIGAVLVPILLWIVIAVCVIRMLLHLGII